MKPFLISFLLLTGFCYAQEAAQTGPISKAPWATETLRPGLVWKSHLFPDLFGAPQSLNLLIWDPSVAHLNMVVAYRDSALATVSTFADSAQAVVAINGGFFNMKHGGAVSFLRSGGKTIARSQPEVVAIVDEAALAIDEKGKAILPPRPTPGWEELPSYPETMVSGPLLLRDGKFVAQLAYSFNLKRHPRSGIGLTSDGKLIFITADGRSEKADGLTTLEFARLFRALGCKDALNLDGGGSTTLWIRDEGVVNYPSDNRRFDHQGERPVANAWLLVEP